MINFKKAAILGAIFSSALILSACNLYKTSGTNQTEEQNQEQTQTQNEQTQATESAATVTFSDSGVSPAISTIKSGQSITWTNSGSKTVQVGSDNHPTHTLNKELTNGAFVTDLAPGASVTIALTKSGTWGFHDHLNPNVRGKVIVE